jgi:1,4-dihydroxy-2-naphthoyl-CoA hydrolase
MNLRQSASVEELNVHSENSVAHNCGIHVENIGEDWVQASMPFDERTQSADGSLRLGALAILAESVGSLAAAISVDRDKFICLGQTIEVIHLNAATAGPVKAKATPLVICEEGKRQIWQIDISDATAAPIAYAKLSAIVVVRSPLPNDPRTLHRDA